MRIQGSTGYLEWHTNYDDNSDAVAYVSETRELTVDRIPRTRPGDFVEEIDHIEELLDGTSEAHLSPISLTNGINVMNIIRSAHNSNENCGCQIIEEIEV